MAEGRMLKKAISQSRRLAQLKSDRARLLYTWTLPHLDIEGRFSGEPEIIKGSVIPRIKRFGLKTIQNCLQDMSKNDLVLLYSVDGDKYQQYRKFSDHQVLRKDKEANSKIPPPPEKGTTP